MGANERDGESAHAREREIKAEKEKGTERPKEGAKEKERQSDRNREQEQEHEKVCGREDILKLLGVNSKIRSGICVSMCVCPVSAVVTNLSICECETQEIRGVRKFCTIEI